ncbi:radical SAM protein [Thermodesulfatator indicus]|uniref:radical SAM protein n=1 Tax=Thermodesulfatator indicus TaxID=171695 RepID=UPI002479C890|nr:radical SAM protein [Thermodesulfatator indicus]
MFFSGCNLACVFCQTYEISREGLGQEISSENLASIMLELSQKGCHNINLVSPSHQVYQILEGLELAWAKGLTLPVVYNTGSYDKVETLKALEGLIDIYLADFKLWSPELAAKYLGARDYPEVAKKAIKEMYRQVGDLVFDNHGLARRGLILRHLVMPGLLGETEKILVFLKEELSTDIYLNLMGHYHPAGQAHNFSEINRTLTKKEYEEALKIAKDLGFKNLDTTHRALLELLLPD